MTSSKNFRENLRVAIQARGYSQREFAACAGVSYPYVNRVIGGKVHPSLEMCDTMADALNCELKDMLLSPSRFLRTIEEFSGK